MADRPKLAQGARRTSLAWLLGVSLMLHLLLIWLVPMPQRESGAASVGPRLQVRMGPSERPVTIAESRGRMEDYSPSHGTAAVAGSAMKRVPVPGSDQIPQVNVVPSALHPGGGSVTAALLESARQIARKESTRFDGQQGKTPGLEGGKASPEAVVAAMAARSRIQLEETRLADGTLRVVNQWGVRYCSKAPPDFQRSGPVGHDAVVTNCL